VNCLRGNVGVPRNWKSVHGAVVIVHLQRRRDIDVVRAAFICHFVPNEGLGAVNQVGSAEALHYQPLVMDIRVAGRSRRTDIKEQPSAVQTLSYPYPLPSNGVCAHSRRLYTPPSGALEKSMAPSACATDI
jgi:hypothetical protein